MTCAGILIVPASMNRFAIRFPNTNYESIYDVSPEAVYQKLIDQCPGLVKHAEKYQAPEEPLADPREIERQLNFEKHDRMRQRPGNER
jgi:hypothetical protein